MTDTTIGQRLKQARKYLRLKARELGEQLGMGDSWQTLYNWETDRTDVPDRYYKKYQDLGINPGWILTGSGSPYADNEAGLQLMKLNGHTSFPASVVVGAKLNPRSEAENAVAAYIKDEASSDQKLIVLEHAIENIGRVQKGHTSELKSQSELLKNHNEKIDDHERRIGRLEANLN
ncbi:MAG: helix-turn-helix transcriptional regulator [Bacteroidetes bacterium]|nr:helix-turn-helix transcriptional regulator [Bacteroidota bacterium]